MNPFRSYTTLCSYLISGGGGSRSGHGPPLFSFPDVFIGATFYSQRIFIIFTVAVSDSKNFLVILFLLEEVAASMA